MDEVQLAIPKTMFSADYFESEEEAKQFKTDNHSLTSVHYSENLDKYYIVKPNVLTEKIEESISDVEKIFNMNVSLGYEFECGRSWADCH